MEKKLKVLVAMSGGVDSSVAAMMMKNLGFRVIGVFMKNYSSNAKNQVNPDGFSIDGENELEGCNWISERKMALRIAALLGIPLITIDSEKAYRKKVVEKMFSDYRRGLTPNPDIECNQKIKFPVLIKLAKKLGADFIATGHYSRIKMVSGSGRTGKRGVKKSFALFRAKDESKDQSYFLYRLRQNELKRVLFPIGNYTKKEIRKIAEKNHFPNFDRKSTVGICFIGKVNMKNFLKKKIKQKKGKILSPEGEVIGFHDGIFYYTIGQRLGPRYGFDLNKKTDDRKFVKRWYVASKDAEKNIIVAAPENHKLNYRKEIIVKNQHWINQKPKNSKLLARIRQVGELLPCKFDGKKVILGKAITGVSEGQAIVLYKGKEVLGGGEIGF